MSRACGVGGCLLPLTHDGLHDWASSAPPMSCRSCYDEYEPRADSDGLCPDCSGDPIEAIRRRSALVKPRPTVDGRYWDPVAQAVADRDTLLAEVDRLRKLLNGG